MCKKKNEVTIRPLSKRTDLGKDNPYVSRLLASMKDKTIHNIGVFGTYGSGKSSVVGSFVKESKKKAIYFSQDTFNKHIHDKDINIREAIYKELLSYNTNSAKLRSFLKSLFKKASDRIFCALLFLLFACSSIFAGFYLYDKINIGTLSAKIVCSAAAGVALFLVELLFYYLFSHNRIKELNINVGQAVSFLVGPEEEITDAISDHPAVIENILIRILNTSDIKFIVVEDIERLDSSKGVEDYLREFKILNDLINRSNEYSNDPIVFIYGLKDWCIGDSEARAKYFDYIISILPYASFSNADDSILSDEIVSKYKISEDLIFDISAYFSNQRQINALITEYETSIEEADSENLKNEQFTLAALNVLYPQAHCLISHKNNFLDFALKSDKTASTFVSSLKTKIIEQFNSLGKKEKLGKLEVFNVDELVLFVKMAVAKGYLTYNYEKLLCKYFKDAMVSADREVFKKINSFESIEDCEIAEPKNLLSRLHENEYIIYTDTKYLNADLTKTIISSEDKTRKEKIVALILKLDVGGLTAFMNKYFKKYPNTSDADELIKIISYDKKAYLASCKTDNPNLACCSCLKFAVVPVLTSNASELKPFFAIVNSKDFMSDYAHQISVEKYKELSETNAIRFEDVSSFHENNDYLTVFGEKNMYKGSFVNFCIIYKGFASNPLHIAVNNSYVKAQMQVRGIDAIIEILDKCDSLSTKDTDKEVIKFLSFFEGEDARLILESKYFDQWELKIPAVLFDASKPQSVTILERGLYNITEAAFVSNNIKAYSEAFSKCIDRISNKLDDTSFVWQDSNEIALNIDSNLVMKISKSLDLASMNNVVSTEADAKKVIKLIRLIGDKEKKEFLQNVATNYSATLVEAAKDKTITADDLNDISLNNSVFISFVSDREDEFVDLFTSELNAAIAINAIQKPNPNVDFSRLFFNKDKSIKKHKNIDLIIAYCSSAANRNFDKVVEIIESLNKDDFSDKGKWKPFILSFAAPETNASTLYFEKFPNNERILDKFYECGLLTEKQSSSKNKYKCKFVKDKK